MGATFQASLDDARYYICLFDPPEMSAEVFLEEKRLTYLFFGSDPFPYATSSLVFQFRRAKKRCLFKLTILLSLLSLN